MGILMRLSLLYTEGIQLPYSGKFSRGIKFRVFREYIEHAKIKIAKIKKFAVLVAYARYTHIHAEERVNLRRQIY